MAMWEVPLDLSPSSKKLNSYNSTKDSLHNTQTCLWYLHDETCEGGRIGVNREGGEGEVQRWGLWSQGEGRIGTAGALCGPEHFYLSDQYIIQLNPAVRSQDVGQRPNAEVWQWWSNGPHCQAENKTTTRNLVAFPHCCRAFSSASSQR